MNAIAKRAIKALDRALGKVGQTVTLQRPGAGAVVVAEATVKAVIHNYAPAELVGGIIQGDSRVILSPTGIVAANWPSAGGDPVPRKGDRLSAAGRGRVVESATPFRVGDDLVRIELLVRG